LRHYNRTLEKVFTFLKSQGRMGKIKQVFRQLDNTAILKEYSNELNHAQERFAVP
jgi:chromosome condensin MukBEF MukE localization factor